jgi:hypothetical protein
MINFRNNTRAKTRITHPRLRQRLSCEILTNLTNVTITISLLIVMFRPLIRILRLFLGRYSIALRDDQ